ncbi:MAG TPA: hypothetical protein VF970_00350 [Gemmatimonadales bacterium]
MEPRKPGTIALTVLAYVVTTFAVQGGSHFAVNADHYAAISIMRPEPIIPMGLVSMAVQGLLFALLFPSFNRQGSTARNALVFSWALGAFLASYIALAEAGKYAVPSISSWVAVEASVALVQYTVFGILLGLVHRRSAHLGVTGEIGSSSPSPAP